jgi:uncharacterized protein (DUF697 family)
VAALPSNEHRQLAYEMAVCVCDSDGGQNDAERTFLADLRRTLGLEGDATAAAAAARADAITEAAYAPVPAIPPPLPAAAALATTAGAAIPSRVPESELDKSILNTSILNGALELLPQSWATMAIIPLQVRLVYRVGKAYGVELDQGHIKEFIATIGVGMTSQVVENFARDLLGGLARKFLGKTAGKMVKTATGAAMSFATTYALGQVAKQYYAGGRRLSSVDLRALFGREVERAKALYAQHRPEIEQSAKTLDAKQVLSMVRGG